MADVDNDQLVYRIGSQLWTDGPVKKTSHSVAVVGRDELVQYLETQGRTWHRQLLLKARTIAGDKPFGDEFLQDMEPWVFQRYLTRADIAELKALKRRIEKRSHRSGADDRNVVSGRGGMLDVEFVIQFLQLLNGGDAREIREANTLLAIEQLAAMACINSDERQILADGYDFLCRIRRRLQISFGSEAESLPVDQSEFDLLARHLEYTGDSTALRDVYLQRTGLIRRVLDHLLHDAFDDGTESAPEIDLMLDPNPSVEQIENALSPYGFTNPSGAYDRLVDLATERIRFLSTRRCRTFLAAIAPSLLDVIGKTPVPDETLTNLCRVSDSLGGKGVLWELFSYSPPTLDLYVRLCACSRYLSDMLTSNPGMLDDLMDSLVQNKLPSAGQLQLRLDELCRGADDVDPILHSFKNSQHLTAGVRDILGKDDITDTMAFLSDVAEVCLRQIANHQYQLLVRKYGQPTTEAGTQCEYAIFGLGKLGGREPNYHSNFDIVLVYESNGVTEVHQTQKDRNKAVSTQNHHFFHELAQKVVQQSNRVGPLGRLFEVAVDRHVGGTSGAMAITLQDFARQFLNENVAISAWQSLCRIRPILGVERFRQNVIGVITQLLIGHVPSQPLAQQIYHSRMKLEENASELNLKRAAGGTLDVEFVVQSIQLQHAAVDASVLAPGTVDGLERLEEHGLMASEDAEYLAESYRFLRGVEARLRLMNTGARHDLPTDDDQLKRLALLLSMDSGDSLRGECLGRMRGVRERFLKYVPEVSSE